ncbi:MAG: hypothetical protein HY744_06805 [Deltaproteobacteria bacterium]|nr:hypothetical protein [Deltaproteobacteria bacterium]
MASTKTAHRGNADVALMPLGGPLHDQELCSGRVGAARRQGGAGGTGEMLPHWAGARPAAPMRRLLLLLVLAFAILGCGRETPAPAERTEQARNASLALDVANPELAELAATAARAWLFARMPRSASGTSA